MKKFLDEFKAFAIKGNMIDMAIGMIIGAGFTGLVNGLVNSIINPLIAILLGGKTDFSSYVFSVNGVDVLYGAFITSVINFLITALVVFMFVKMMNKLRDLGKKEEVVVEEVKEPEISSTDKLLMEILEELKKD